MNYVLQKSRVHELNLHAAAALVCYLGNSSIIIKVAIMLRDYQ